MTGYRGIEFTCVDCGAHVQAAIAVDAEPSCRCALCFNLPGWWENARLRELFTRGDPDRRIALDLRFGACDADAA